MTSNMANKINIIVQSTLSGKAAGFQTVSISAKDRVDAIISSYCIAKEIPQKSYYILRTSKNIPLDSTRLVETYSLIEDGETLFLGSKADEDTMFGFNNWWVIAFMSLFIGGIGLVSVVLVYTLDVPKQPINYSIVMDAGSTHTTTYLFDWKSSKVKQSHEVKQLKSCTGKAHGISSYESNPGQAGSSLTDCIKEIKGDFPKDDQKTAGIYLGATAGMRLLNLSSEATALKVMYSVESALRASGFTYKSSKIISGESEGEYAWIALNYLNKNFQLIKPHKSHHTVGSLDLGGASTQIAYEIPTNSSINPKLFGETYNIHSQTFLCYGMSKIYLRHVASLIKDPTSAETMYSDPCAPKGHQVVLTPQKLYSSVCSQSTFVKKHIDVIMKHKNFTISGGSNPAECSRRISDLFNKAECIKDFPSNLCFNGVPNFQHSRFLAISGFYSAVSFLNATNVSLSSYESQLKNFCGKSWSQLKVYLPNPYLSRYCFDGQYIHHLLVEGYGFNSSYWTNLKFAQTINGTDLGWALGFVLSVTSDQVGLPRSSPPISLLVLCIMVVLFAIFILLSLAFGYHAIKQRRYKWSHQRKLLKYLDKVILKQ